MTFEVWYNCIMTQNDQEDIPTEPQLCTKCKEMYGNKRYDHMCSLCYK